MSLTKLPALGLPELGAHFCPINDPNGDNRDGQTTTAVATVLAETELPKIGSSGANLKRE
ncbi:hypothetical protein Fmac_008501 [Flemingia macrophylla]|uniref:Uncharacterized protein n=1 Tax=Flemingia macrophylla TaxID=520843 RepID=A0ABD1MY44_9FABA